MPYSYQLSEEAEEDVYEGYLWYEEQREGLGEEFLDTLDKVKQSILSNPKTYPVRYRKRVHMYVVQRFPYIVLYVVKAKEIKVLAVFNTNKNPKKLKKRIG